MTPFTNDEITALLCDAMPAARNLAESKATEVAEANAKRDAEVIAALPDSLDFAPVGSGE